MTRRIFNIDLTHKRTGEEHQGEYEADTYDEAVEEAKEDACASHYGTDRDDWWESDEFGTGYRGTVTKATLLRSYIGKLEQFGVGSNEAISGSDAVDMLNQLLTEMRADLRDAGEEERNERHY